MNCKKCGYKLEENWKACPKCAEIIENKNEINAERNKNEQELQQNDGKYKIYLVVFLISIVCGIFIAQLRGISFLVALITIVTGFIKYPQSRAIKVLFWLFLIGVIAYIVFIIFLVYFCAANVLISYRCP